MTNFKPIKKFLIGTAIGIVILSALLGGAAADRLFGIKPLDKFFQRGSGEATNVIEKKIVDEESTAIAVYEKAAPSVVTISVQTPRRQVLEFSPFGGFGVKEKGGGEQDLATGFIVSPDGLIVTNKHVVSETNVKYKAITKEGKDYEIQKIYKDPVNDIALIKVDAEGLPAVELGDSDKLKVGQTVIAIGTPLGQFRTSLTKGVISGLGRGIDAGSGNPLEGTVERLDNVIQTDAAINPGNSGGPLINSGGQVIGVNVAVAVGAENIGFAIPINIVKSSIDEFKKTGEFTRPFLGIQYQMISRQAAIANDIPQGAYVVDVVSSSAADKAGIKTDDIITKFGGTDVKDEKGGLATLVGRHKVGETVEVEIWREQNLLTLSVTLSQAP